MQNQEIIAKLVTLPSYSWVRNQTPSHGQMQVFFIQTRLTLSPGMNKGEINKCLTQLWDVWKLSLWKNNLRNWFWDEIFNLRPATKLKQLNRSFYISAYCNKTNFFFPKYYTKVFQTHQFKGLPPTMANSCQTHFGPKDWNGLRWISFKKKIMQQKNFIKSSDHF